MRMDGQKYLNSYGRFLRGFLSRNWIESSGNGSCLRPFRIGCTAMSSVIDNDDTNNQWPVVTVVLYQKKNVQTNEVKEFVTLENILTNEVIDFMHMRLSTLKG